MKDIKNISNHPSKKIASSGTAMSKQNQGGHQMMQLGLYQLWRSLPRPCKLFLVVCIVQAFVAGAFAARELARPGLSTLQDLILILVSAIYFLLLVLDAFYHENGSQLLVSMASGGLNLVQLIVYATALNTGDDGASLAVVIACAVLQAVAVALARWAYLGFGWRMYSKIACDATLPDAERRRAVGLRLGRFFAVAKLDIQILCLLLVVGVVNGANPGGASSLPPLIAVATVGVTAAAAWLIVCWTAVASARPHVGLAAEFTYPICYIVAAAFMFSSVFYGSRLAQLHGQVYLFVYPVLFVASHTWVWWDARLLSVSDIARDQRDFAAQQKAAKASRGAGGKGGAAGATTTTGGVGATINLTANATGAAVNTNNNTTSTHVPPEILPLVHGAWLLKLPSATAFHSLTSAGDSSFATNHTGSESPAKRTLRELLAAAKASTNGRWRYFQLSHDGSTLRWDWRKFVLLVHVESVSCCTEDLTITLSLTLEPDLRLKFSDPELHATWARGLTLLVMLLGNPDGLEGRQQQHHNSRVGTSNDNSADGGDTYGEPPSFGLGRRGSLSSREVGAWATSSISEQQPGSPNRLLYRLASASGRASAAGLLTKEALEYAAWQARKALGDTCSQPPSPDSMRYTNDPTNGNNSNKISSDNGGKNDLKEEDDDLEKGNLSSLESSEKDEIVISAIPKNSSGSSGVGHSVISLHATAVNSSTPRRRLTGGSGGTVVIGSGGGGSGGVLRQRTPTRGGRNGTPPLPNQTHIVIGIEPSPSKSRRQQPGGAGDTRSWLRRTLTAPVSTLTAGFQHAAEGAARQLTFVTNTTSNNITGTPPSPFDVEANAGATNSGGGGAGRHSNNTYSPLSPSYSSGGGYVPPTYGSRRLFNTPPRNNNNASVPIPPSTLTSGSRSRLHLRSASLDGGSIIMPPVPEGSGSFTPAASLNFGPGGGVYHIVANAAHSRFAQNNTVAGIIPTRASSVSPGSAGGGSGGKGAGNGGGGIAAVMSRPRPSSPLKPANLASNNSGPATISLMAVAAVGANNNIAAAPLMRYASAPMYSLQHALSGLEPADSETSLGGVSNNGNNPTGLPPPFPNSTAAAAAAAHNGVAALQRMGSDVSWHIHSPPPGQVGGALARYDSLGPQIAPGSKLWQAMFDAGMATYQMSGSGAVNGGSVEGSPSPSATPHSVARSVVAVNMELIDFEQLSFGRMLGEGAEGPVYAAWFQETPVAVKRASSQDEVDLHLQAGWHDNVVNLRGLAQHGGHTYLVMELCPRGTLDVLIHQSSSSSASALTIDPAKLMPIVRSIARGMLHLHTRSPPVLHRDLKPANIFIGHGYVMKIGDFGMARYGADTRAHRAAQAHLDPGKFGTGISPLLRTLTPGVIGTAAYCAPELLHPETPKAAEEFNEERLLKADVYSFGVLLWELLERKRPYYGMDGIQIQTQWILDPGSMRLKPPKVPDSCKTAAARKVAQSLSDLVAVCTAWDPDERPNFKEILAILRGIGQDGEVPPTPAANPF